MHEAAQSLDEKIPSPVQSRVIPGFLISLAERMSHFDRLRSDTRATVILSLLLLHFRVRSTTGHPNAWLR
jgi:hypothetical protein